MTDVNECARFVGTDLGCQNKATCRNLPGSYRYAILVITLVITLQQVTKFSFDYGYFNEFAIEN